MNKYLDNIKNHESVRQNLIDLKSAIKDGNQKKALAYQLAGDFSVFLELLDHEDPKVRKNAVLILGEMECDDLAADIWKAYEKEQTLFVKADYLKSLNAYECRELLGEMKSRWKELSEKAILPEDEKHIHAEMSALQKLITKNDGQKGHRFVAFDKTHTIILITNRNQREATGNQLSEEVKYLAGGLRLKTERLEEILKIRTFHELLFPVPGMSALDVLDEKTIGMLTKRIMIFLEDTHSGTGPYYFRVEIRGITDRDQKQSMAKKISYQLEKASSHTLENSTSSYEIEIRIIANKKGQYVPLLKLFTLNDQRFAYRKEVLPTSIAPYNAALLMELAKNYLKEDAQVLDPFCGTGTMLIERCRLGHCSSVYGLDILEEAVQKARVNTELAHLPIHYINRDYFDFRHDYLFDEIISNLPTAGKTRNTNDILVLYERFFQKSREVLKREAVLVLFTTMPEVLQEAMKGFMDFEIVEEFVINEREGSICYVVTYHGK